LTGRDALSKYLYDKMFEFLIVRINQTLSTGIKAAGTPLLFLFKLVWTGLETLVGFCVVFAFRLSLLPFPLLLVY
jgi:hypothetical protein